MEPLEQATRSEEACTFPLELFEVLCKCYYGTGVKHPIPEEPYSKEVKVPLRLASVMLHSYYGEGPTRQSEYGVEPETDDEGGSDIPANDQVQHFRTSLLSMMKAQGAARPKDDDNGDGHDRTDEGSEGARPGVEATRGS